MILRKFILITILIGGLVSGSMINPVYAREGGGAGSDLGGSIQDLIKDNDFEEGENAMESLVEKIVQITMPVAVLAILILFSYAGILMVTSQGNPEKLKQAREVVVNAVLGFIMIALAASILSIITSTLSL